MVQPSELRQVITAERSKADAQQAQVEADSIRIEKEAKDWTVMADGNHEWEWNDRYSML